ncbi:hypothetical protein BKN37_08890 [Mycobacterium talmoniae]|uniref:Uncharacterized protein n=1 Tax=Mycobacterium talmoniae TaxID=1858794 RepID=A0A1S1NKP5_9MYCO|nr:hypothetical protein [Mycobacterium eburneum]OHV04676.1 hypothetical protein BKN37_08890 [Mycobacterium talmoniae]TDH49292.1 hypothetical protein E2F47_21005 [Mycobacterium eburneum]
MLLVVVLLVVAGGVVAVRWWHPGGRDDAHGGAGKASVPQEAPMGTPKDRLIGFPLDRQPVPTWQVPVADLGLPRVGDFFAGIGEKAFFVTLSDDENGWVYGLNTRTGKLLFPPVELPGYYFGDCSTNGPSVAVCVTATCKEGPAYDFCRGRERVFVIDLERGKVTFTGEPQVQAVGSLESYHPGRPTLLRIGNHLVATLKGKGVYGVGSQGEPTWFVPGSGDVYQVNADDPDDIAPLTVAVQSSEPENGQPLRVFSVDGRDLTPKPQSGFEPVRAQPYVGGFAVQFDKDPAHRWVGLFDADGKQVAKLDGAIEAEDNVAMPTVLANGLQIYTAAGKFVVGLSTPLADGYRMIGTKLYTFTVPDHWQSWDLFTGEPGPVCDMDLRGVPYVGSDGATIIWRHHESSSYDAYEAVDPATCQTRWTMPVDTGPSSYVELQKAGTSLLQITNSHHPGGAIAGLRAPD